MKEKKGNLTSHFTWGVKWKVQYKKNDLPQSKAIIF